MLAGVEVRVEGGKAAARTDATGAFGLVNAPAGYQNLGFRHIGYLPATISVKVPEISGTVRVMLVPIPPTLDPVTVTARMNVIAAKNVAMRQARRASRSCSAARRRCSRCSAPSGAWRARASRC